MWEGVYNPQRNSSLSFKTVFKCHHFFPDHPSQCHHSTQGVCVYMYVYILITPEVHEHIPVRRSTVFLSLLSSLFIYGHCSQPSRTLKMYFIHVHKEIQTYLVLPCFAGDEPTIPLKYACIQHCEDFFFTVNGIALSMVLPLDCHRLDSGEASSEVHKDYQGLPLGSTLVEEKGQKWTGQMGKLGCDVVSIEALVKLMNYYVFIIITTREF